VIVGEPLFKSGRVSAAPSDWQQECDDAMPARPHSAAIFLQHSFSAAVIACGGVTQLSSGVPNSTSASSPMPHLRNMFTGSSLRTRTVRKQQRVVSVRSEASRACRQGGLHNSPKIEGHYLCSAAFAMSSCSAASDSASFASSAFSWAHLRQWLAPMTVSPCFDSSARGNGGFFV
jgi:hypothetical protein